MLKTSLILLSKDQKRGSAVHSNRSGKFCSSKRLRKRSWLRGGFLHYSRDRWSTELIAFAWDPSIKNSSGSECIWISRIPDGIERTLWSEAMHTMNYIRNYIMQSYGRNISQNSCVQIIRESNWIVRPHFLKPGRLRHVSLWRFTPFQPQAASVCVARTSAQGNNRTFFYISRWHAPIGYGLINRKLY